MRHLFRWLMCLAFTMLPTLANAFEIGEYIYTVTDSVKRTVSLKAKQPRNITGNVSIPAKVEYDGVEYKVTALDEYAFNYSEELISVTIPNTVTYIGNNAFYFCRKLTSVTIPNSVVTIDSYAFSICSSLKSLTIPNSVTTIGAWAFESCKQLTSVIIPNSVTSLGNHAFTNCTGLTSVTISNTVTILNHTFVDCTGLTSVTIPNSVTSMNGTFRGCTGLTSVVIPNSVTSMDGTFEGCTKLTSITIPNSVTSIEMAFKDCTGLTSVSIPNSVTNINNAFRGCTELTNVTIPNSVTSMTYAFCDCAKLTNVTIPNSVTSIDGTFYGCTSLTSIEIPNNVTSIDRTFYGCTSLTSVVIPKSVTVIGSYTFYDCSQLASIEIPDSVSSIGQGAFHNCKNLPELIIPDRVATIGESAFSSTSCTVYYGGNATGSPWGAKRLIRGSVIDGDFVYADKQKTKLVAYLGSDSVITIPDNVKTIAEKIFYNNTGLTSVVIPESVTSIEKQAFYGCTGLKSIVIPDAVSTIGDEAFYSVKRIYYGGAATRSPWGANFHVRGSVFCGDFVYADEQKTKLVFYNGTDSVVTIPDHVRIIGERAFIGNIGITSVSIPDSVTTIETSAFYGCENLTSVNMPSALTTIGDYAFETCQNCRTFSDIILPNSVTSIGRSAFSRVERLYYAGTATGSSWGAEWHIRGNVFDGDFVYADEQKTILAGYIGSDSIVDIPNQVKTIGIGAFLQNQKLYSVNMSNSVVSIEENAFRECPNLTYVALSDSITSIGTYAFFNNKKLISVTIPESVTTIETCAFDNCKGLSSVIVPNSLASIGSSAFRNIDTIYFAGNSPGSPWGAKKWVRGSVFDGDFVYSDEQKENLVFYRGNDSVVIISDQVKVIGEYAFYIKTKLSNVIFPDSLISIKNYAFDGCVLLSSVSVPNDVNTIGTYAFRGTDTLYYGGSATGSPWGARRHIKGVVYDGDFVYADEQKTILNAYLGNDSVVTIPDQVKVIDEYAFYNKTKLRNVIFPDSLISIKNYAFDGCDHLSLVIVPNTVNTIGTYAFRGTNILCYGGNAVGASWGAKRYLKESFTDGAIVYADEGRTNIIAYVGTASVVAIPNSVTSIDANTFNGFETVYYAGTATGSPWGAKRHKRCLVDGDFIYADEEKTKLVAYAGMDSVVVIPKQVKTIGDSAFYGNTKITAVTFSDSVTVIGVATFKNCTSLSSLIVPNSVTKIGTEAFMGIDTVYYLMETDTILIIKDFYVIHNLQEFLTYRDINNKGYHPNGRLDADIDLSPVCGVINGESISWEPIYLGNTTFDGGNHTVSNLYINQPDKSNMGLFYGGNYGIIKNLKVTNAYVKGKDYVAGIASGSVGPDFLNCHFEGIVIGMGYHTRGVGELRCHAYNCSNYGLIVSSQYSYGVAGGDILNCYNRGRIIGDIIANGLEYSNNNCYNAGAIIAGRDVYSIYSQNKKDDCTNLFNLKIEGISLNDEDNIQQLDSSAFLSGAVTDSLNKYVAQNPKTYAGWILKDSIPLLPWVQGEDGFPRFEGVDLQPTQGYIVRFTGKVNNIEVSLDGTINLPVCPVDGCTYVFSNDFDGKNIVSDTTVAVSQIVDPNFLERDDDGFYLIHNGAELAKFRDVVNEGAVAINGRLANDIDLSQECKDSVWTPIGIYYKNKEYNYLAFEGIFDGAGHTIKHLYDITDSPNEWESTHWGRGLFGYTRNATIQNVVVKNSRITGFVVAAIVATAENTTIVNCGSEAELYGYSDYGVASMCANGEGTNIIMNCYNIGKVKGEWQAYAIAAHAHGTYELKNCYSSALIWWDGRSMPENGQKGEFGSFNFGTAMNTRCFADTVICNSPEEYPSVTKTSTDYIKSDAFLADMNAWVDSMNATQSEIVFARWVRDEVDGYPKLQPTHTSSSLPDVRRTTPDGISVYAVDGTIYIHSAHAGKATLYDLHGKAVASVAYTEGLTMVDGLREGVYIVCGVKVIVRRGK